MVHKLLVIGAGFGGNGVITGLSEASQKYDEAEKNSAACLPWSCFQRKASGKSLFPGDLEITMLDRKTNFSIGGTWQFVWSSRLIAPIIEWPFAYLHASDFDNVQLLTGPDNATVEKLLPKEKRVILTNGKSLQYDTLVLSPGVISDPSEVPGLVPEKATAPTKQALDICNLKHVPLIQQGIDQVMLEAKKSPKTILVCVTRMPYKCPPVPFEVASILDDLRRERGVLDNVKIVLSVPVPFPFAGPPAAALFKDLLKEQNIEFLNNHEVTKIVDGMTVHYRVVGGEENVTKVIKADLLLTTFPQRAPDFCKPLCDANGYITVDLQTNKVKSETDIYAIGDVCHAMFPKPDKPHPKAGEFAYLMGRHVADQIVASIKSPKGTSVPPPSRKASCVAECGVAGKGVNIEPNFTDILASPETGMPVFNFPVVDDAAGKKTDWVNGYLTKFFSPGKVAPFGTGS